MKKLLLTRLFLTIELTIYATTSDNSVLRTDSLAVHGNMLAMMNQQMEVQVFNLSKTNDYEARWYLLRRTENGSDILMDTLVNIKAGSDFTLLYYIRLPEGSSDLTLATDENGEHPIAGNMVFITALRKLNIQSEINIQMLSTENGRNMLNGKSLKGSVRMKSFDEYKGCREAGDTEDGVWLWLEEVDSKQQVAAIRLATTLGYAQKSTYPFDFTADLSNGVTYALHFGYMAPDGMVKLASQTFTVRTDEITYWTANEQVLPLSAVDGVLPVPAEAVAVDFRGKSANYASMKIDIADANPNCLYYLDESETMPEGLDTNCNLICGGEAERVQVVENNDYYCPLAFHIKYISYLMKPSYETEDEQFSSRGYSETLVLPFNVGHACIYDVNNVQETLHADMLKVLRYDGNQGDSLKVSPVGSFNQMKAYTPYILGVYVGSRLLFSAEDATVPMTREAIALGQSINFVGTTVAMESSEESFLYDSTSGQFHKGSKHVPPFRAYMERKDLSESFERLQFDANIWGERGIPGDEHSTSINNPLFKRNEQLVYSLAGQRVSHAKSGLYIVGGKKKIVK